MRLAKIALELGLEIFCSWTLAYELCLLLRAPAISIVIPFTLLICPMLYVSARHWKAGAKEPADWPVVLALLLIALAVGGFTLIARRPDPDDSLLFQRALNNITALSRPILFQDSSLDVPGIMVGTVLHHMTSYELLAAMAAKLLRLDPLWFYQSAMPFFAAAFLPFVYYFLYREFGVSKAVSIAATVLAILFLFIDGNSHRSFGNFGFVRLWQGKCIVVTLLLPATFLLTKAFLMRPGKMAFFRLAMVGVSGIGLSEVGVYLIPMMVLVLSVAYLVTERLSAVSFRRAGYLWISMFFPLLIGAGLLVGVLPKPKHFTELFLLGFSTVWWKDLQIVVDSGRTAVRDLLIILVVPLLALKGRPRWFVVSLGTVLLLMLANPPMGKLWIHLMFPASYWRMVYLFPLPWLFGLLAPAVLAGVGETRPIPALVRPALMVAIVTSVMAAFHSSVICGLGPAPKFELVRKIDFKSPLGYQLPPAELEFARAARADLHDKDVLGPDSINYVIGLLDPNVRFAVTRADYTIFGFANSAQPAEWRPRFAAQGLVSSCADTVESEAGLRHCISNGVNAIITHGGCESRPDPMPGILLSEGVGSWKEVRRQNDYVLYVKGP
jgi:hypothetical protein